MKLLTEKDVQKTCLEWLVLFGAVAVRVNSGAMKVGDRFVRFNTEDGCADVLACLPPNGRWLSLELKKPGRDRTSPERLAKQAAHRERVVRAGGLAVTATSLDELRAALREEGYSV